MIGQSKLLTLAVITILLFFIACNTDETDESFSYTVVYNTNGGNGIMENTNFTNNIWQNLRTSTFTRTGYTFAGWATSPTGTVVYTNEQSVKNLAKKAGETVILYAAWGYTVRYNAGDGSGNMENSDFILGASQNLRINTFTHPKYDFIGWATSASGPVVYTNGQETNDLTSATVTLYAVWGPLSIDFNSSLADKLAWLKINAQNDTDYTFIIISNEIIAPANLSYSGKNNINITLKSTGLNYTISLSSNGSLFMVGSGVTLTLDNSISLQGRSDNNASLVKVNNGGTFVMNTGSYIRNNTFASSYNSACGGGVYVDNNGTFIMHDGEISNNSVSATTGMARPYGGGVYVNTNGVFTMYDGKISGNSCVHNSSSAYSYGGGVFAYGTFTMNGGEISDNSISSTATGTSSTSSEANGGGVCVSGGTFTMNNGKISRNSVAATATTNYSHPSGGGVYFEGESFTMNGGEISSNVLPTSGYSYRYGGGVYVSGGNFRLTNGTIFSNNASNGSQLYNYGGTAQYGTFNGTVWNSNGSLASTGDTIDNSIIVVDGVLK